MIVQTGLGARRSLLQGWIEVDFCIMPGVVQGSFASRPCLSPTLHIFEFSIAPRVKTILHILCRDAADNSSQLPSFLIPSVPTLMSRPQILRRGFGRSPCMQRVLRYSQCLLYCKIPLYTSSLSSLQILTRQLPGFVLVAVRWSSGLATAKPTSDGQIVICDVSLSVPDVMTSSDGQVNGMIQIHIGIVGTLKQITYCQRLLYKCFKSDDVPSSW